MLHNPFNASLLVYLSDSKRRTYTPPKPNIHRPWMVGKTTLLALGRVGPPWRPGPRPPPRRRGSHPSTVRPRSTFHHHTATLPQNDDFFIGLKIPPFESGCVLYLHDFLYDNLLGQWYLSDFYSMRVYENILPTSYWCFWQYVLVNWKSGHWMRVIQTLEFGQEIWQRLSINVNTMFEAILSRTKNPYPTLGSSENHRLKKCRLKTG